MGKWPCAQWGSEKSLWVTVSSRGLLGGHPPSAALLLGCLSCVSLPGLQSCPLTSLSLPPCSTPSTKNKGINKWVITNLSSCKLFQYTVFLIRILPIWYLSFFFDMSENVFVKIFKLLKVPLNCSRSNIHSLHWTCPTDCSSSLAPPTPLSHPPGYVFCMLHRLPEQHDCLFDHLGRGRQEAVLKMVKLDRKVGRSCQRIGEECSWRISAIRQYLGTNRDLIFSFFWVSYFSRFLQVFWIQTSTCFFKLCSFLFTSHCSPLSGSFPASVCLIVSLLLRCLLEKNHTQE